MTPAPVLTADMLAEVSEIPDCDFHKLSGEPGVPAAYDGETKRGLWAFMCRPCFRDHGIGLGLGVGQQLVLKGDPLARRIGTVGSPDPTPAEKGPVMTRRKVQRLGQASVAAALLVGSAVPATRYIATAVFIAAVLLTVAATIRPNRGKS